MKPNSWRRLALPVVVAGAIAMTVSIGDGGATVKATKDRGVAAKTSNPPAQHATAAGSESSGPKQKLSLRVELERLARPMPEQENLQQAIEPQDTAQHDAAAENGDGIFRVTSWYVPPPPPPPQPPPPPPKPTAPPMPFSYLGRYQEAQTVILMLVRGDRIYTVTSGDVIDNIYRVEGVVGGRVELTYLPLNIKQTIDTGEAS